MRESRIKSEAFGEPGEANEPAGDCGIQKGWWKRLEGVNKLGLFFWANQIPGHPKRHPREFKKKAPSGAGTVGLITIQPVGILSLAESTS